MKPLLATLLLGAAIAICYAFVATIVVMAVFELTP